MSEKRSAILLLAHGTPDKLSEMAAYLDKVTGGRPMSPEVVEELQHRYAEIGLREEPLPEGPPLTRWTLKQAALLQAEVGTPVYVGMRNWHPFIADTVAQMKADGVTHARVLCLAPQNSRTSVGLYRRALMEAVSDTGRVRRSRWSSSPDGRMSRCWRGHLRSGCGRRGPRPARRSMRVCRCCLPRTRFRAAPS
jgi:ferrochelatase